MSKVEPSNLKEPLLNTGSSSKKDEVDPEAPPTKEELDKELEDGTMSWLDLINFFINPQHWMVTMMASYTFFCLLLFVEYEATHPTAIFHSLLTTTLLCIAGLSGATYTAFLAEQLKDEVNKYRTLVKKLRQNKSRLEETAESLQQNVDTMQEEVENFRKLQSTLEEQGEKIGGGLKEVLQKSKDVCSKLEQTYKDQMSTLLSDVAQSFELSDDSEGMSLEEFTKFMARLPKDLLKNEELRKKFEFDAIWENGEKEHDEDGNKVLTISDLMVVIDEACALFKC